MSIVWLITLCIYGGVEGFSGIPGLMWWLLVPMAYQDNWDVNRKR